jgi:hypothetical protein
VERAPADVKVVYVLGSSRGGTSIVGRILGLMQGAVFAGELRRLWGPARQPGRTCGCGRPLAECEVWSQMLHDDAKYPQPDTEAVVALQDRVAPVRHSWWSAAKILRRHGPPDDAAKRYLDVLTDLYRSFANTTGASIVVDSSKNAGDAALLAQVEGLNSYCVHVVRDPRGVVLSRRRDLADPTRSRPWNAARTAGYWTLAHLTAEAISRRYGDRHRLVRYEGFVDHPSRTLEEVARMVGSSVPQIRVESGVPIRVQPAHGPDGHGRFATEEVVLRPDERWLEMLSTPDRNATALVTFPLLRRYDYPIRTDGLPRRAGS